MVQQQERPRQNQIKDRAERVSKGRKEAKDAEQISEAWDPGHESGMSRKITPARKWQSAALLQGGVGGGRWISSSRGV